MEEYGGTRLSVLGVWVVGVVADEVVEEARRRFPAAADAHGAVRPESSAEMSRLRALFEPGRPFDGTPERLSRDLDAARLVADAVDEVRNNEDDADELQDYLLSAIPQNEHESVFCATVRKGDAAAALMWGLGLDTAFRLPGCGGQLLLDAAQARAALPAAEQALDLRPARRAHAAARIRQWLDETADDPNHDIDELLAGPLRVLRHAAHTGSGATGLVLWY